ncbi:UNVERIFIED_CONTAM: hypothetical protein Sradi_7233200 [Sesamum radiatum]|uniref:Uncharacterized protein n=1 Tax=Sesamum radiatum TaxID=300843 RepID=A0AAW2IMT5_SESRA
MSEISPTKSPQHNRLHPQATPSHLSGAPLYKGNKKCILYDTLIAKMRSKLQGWAQSSLSHGGRLALIKSTLCSMPLHLIQVINPPKTIIHCIEQIMARFFWGSTKSQKNSLDFMENNMSAGGGRRTWYQETFGCCGGLSPQALVAIQKSMLALGSVPSTKYCRGTFAGQVKVSIHDSPHGKGCARHIAQDQIFWTLGTGKASFWFDNWIGEQTFPNDQFSFGWIGNGELLLDRWAMGDLDLTALFLVILLI